MTGTSRITQTFETLKAQHKTALVTYVTAGDPDLERSADILKAIDASGADVLEVGVPFSDPLADGPVIQRASERALAAGATIRRTLELIDRVRGSIRAPIVLFTYANPVLRMSIEAFAQKAADVGVDGVLVLDLPIEEAGELRNAISAVGIDVIFLLSPTTTATRMKTAATFGSGFLYGISRLGVTGARAEIADGVRDLVGRIRAVSSLPVAVGFGISRPEHVRQVGEWADGAVVGSALVSVIAEAAGSKDLTTKVADFVRLLKSGSSRANGAGA